MAYFWICGVCGMEQHECDAVTSLTAAALAKAINPNFPMKNERSGSSGQNASKEYSNVQYFSMCLYMKSHVILDNHKSFLIFQKYISNAKHLKEKRYECNHCCKTFLTSWALKIHIDNEHIMEIDNYIDEGI